MSKETKEDLSREDLSRMTEEEGRIHTAMSSPVSKKKRLEAYKELQALHKRQREESERDFYKSR